MSELAEPWSERRHAAESLLREVLGVMYPLAPAADDPLRLSVESALVRRAAGPYQLTAQQATDLLQERLWQAFPGSIDDLLVEWKESRGLRSLRIQYGYGPAWLPMRAWADNPPRLPSRGCTRPWWCLTP